MITQNNQEKKNQVWRAILLVSTVLIIIIAAFFIVKLFTANPLEGRWVFEDSNMVMTVKGDNTATIEWPDEFENANVTVVLDYNVDKETKTFTLQANEANIEKAAGESDGAVTAEGLKSAVGTLEATYDYSIEKNTLTLTDREYGNQMIFDKK